MKLVDKNIVKIRDLPIEKISLRIDNYNEDTSKKIQ